MKENKSKHMNMKKKSIKSKVFKWIIVLIIIGIMSAGILLYGPWHRI